MKTINRSTSSTTYGNINFHNNYKLWDNLDLTVRAHASCHGLQPGSLFEMGLRINKKRQFLFISKLIAKHLAVHPALALGTGTLLASLLMEDAGLPAHAEAVRIARMIDEGRGDSALMSDALSHKAKLPGRTVFIGMAETATGLGHSVFQHFEEAHYIHTTRERIAGAEPSFVFEEEHSHATSHQVFAPAGMLEDADTIVLIDDEISTGNTIINLVRALDEQFPGKRYKCLSILDWRNDDQRDKLADFAAGKALEVDVLALLSGEFTLHHGSSPEETPLPQLSGHTETAVQIVDGATMPHRSVTGQGYVPFTGRFGLASDVQQELDRWIDGLAGNASPIPAGERALVIGIGENMYVPLRFALALGGDVLVQTTTRSPIFAKPEAGYPIREKTVFRLPDAEETDQYLYNLSGVKADRIYLIAESVVDRQSWLPLVSYLEEKAPVQWISLTN